MSHSSPSGDRSGVSWADAARQAAFERWLAPLAQRHALRVDTLRPASRDASFRRYLRVDAQAGPSLIVMDAPPALENCAAFLHVQALMHQAGLNVPRVLASSLEHGFLLLGDLGPQPLIHQLDAARPGEAHAWYMAAVDVLLRWQAASRPGLLPPYDAALLRMELQLFADWYVARHRRVRLGAAQQERLHQAFEAIIAHNLAAPRVFVHRDFMMRNLLPPLEPGGALGVLDFQDALCGPVSYDIACLMQDAFISWEEDFVLDITVRYWERARAGGLLGGWGRDFADFYRAVQWMGLQRHLKVAGVFARLALRDHKPRYLQDAPRFIGYIRSTCARWGELAPLLRLVEFIEDNAFENEAGCAV